MKKLLSLIAMIGIILAIAAPMGAMAADEIIGYEFNGTKDGWVSCDSNATIDNSTLLNNGLQLPTQNADKDILYDSVKNWGDTYTYSVDLQFQDWNNKGNGGCILFNNNGKSDGKNAWYGHRLQINTTSGVSLKKENGWSDRVVLVNSLYTSAPADMQSATGVYENWHVEIKYDKGNVEVWLKPIGYEGNAWKAIDYVNEESTWLTGQIGISNTNLSRKCQFTNIKVEKTVAETASYDYNWNGGEQDIKFYKQSSANGNLYATNGELRANGCDYRGNAWAAFDTLKWSGNTTIKCYMQAYSYNTGSSVCVLFNSTNDNNAYKLEIKGRNTMELRKIVNGSTTLLVDPYSETGTPFYYGDLEINYNDGKINVWFTAPGKEKQQIFKDVEDTTYTGGHVIFGVKTEGTTSNPTLFKNISISGDFTASNEICTAQVSGVQKLSNGTITSVEFSGTGFEAEAGATLTNDMDLKVPVRYAKASGDVNAAVLVAYYDEYDVMLDVEMTKVPLSSAKREWIDVPIGKAMPSGATKVRCFIWNASTLCPALELSHAN